MQVVYALEAFFDLSIIVLDHLNYFLDGLFCLTTFEVEA